MLPADSREIATPGSDEDSRALIIAEPMSPRADRLDRIAASENTKMRDVRDTRAFLDMRGMRDTETFFGIGGGRLEPPDLKTFAPVDLPNKSARIAKESDGRKL
jgi:hypothetical protein